MTTDTVDEFFEDVEYCMECLAFISDDDPDLNHYPHCPNKEQANE